MRFVRPFHRRGQGGAQPWPLQPCSIICRRKSPVHALTGAAKLIVLPAVHLRGHGHLRHARACGAAGGERRHLHSFSRIRLREVRFMLTFTLVFLLLNNFFIFLFNPDQGSGALWHAACAFSSSPGRYDVTGGAAVLHAQHLAEVLRCRSPWRILFICATNPERVCRKPRTASA